MSFNLKKKCVLIRNPSYNQTNVIRSLILVLLLLVAVVTSPILYHTYIFYNTGHVAFPSGESDLRQSKVYLIGSRHQPTVSYNADSLYQQLEKIRPDVILLEWDSNFFNNNSVKWQYRQVIPPYYKKINNLEILGATKYSKNHEKVILAPFEWDSTSLIHQQIRGKSRTSMMKALWNTKSDTSTQVLKECGKLRSDMLNLQDLPSFNTNLNDSLMERFINLEYEVIPSLVLRNDVLKEYHPIAEKFKDYWPIRNSNMGKNILQAINEYPKSKIVVLTGFRHRYFLRQYLSRRSSDDDFELLDYQGSSLALPEN